MSFNLISFQLRTIINLRIFLFIGLSAILNFFIVASVNTNMIPLGNVRATISFFYFPVNSNLDLYRLLLVVIPILISVGSFVQHQTKDSSLYVLLHCKNYKNWFLSMTIASWVFTMGMILFQYLITYIGTFFIPKGDPSDEWLLVFPSLYSQPVYSLLFQQLSLFTLSLLVLITFYLLLFYSSNQVNVSFLVSVIYLAISYLFVLTNPDIFIWYPLAYGLAGLMEWSGFLGYGPLFLLLVLLLSVLFGLTYIIFCLRRESLLVK